MKLRQGAVEGGAREGTGRGKSGAREGVKQGPGASMVREGARHGSEQEQRHALC